MITEWIWVITAILATASFGYLLGIERGHSDIIGKIIRLEEERDGESDTD